MTARNTANPAASVDAPMASSSIGNALGDAPLSSIVRREVLSREELTRAKMKRILICVLDYQSDKKEWPDVKSWDGQLKPYFARDSFFSPETVVVDGWGNRIKYGVKNEGAHSEAFLYSCGRNGVDDKGTNDDILIPISP